MKTETKYRLLDRVGELLAIVITGATVYFVTYAIGYINELKSFN
jgi:hypothetical protein